MGDVMETYDYMINGIEYTLVDTYPVENGMIAQLNSDEDILLFFIDENENVRELSEEEEQFHRAELFRMKKEQKITDETFYHYDTPLTVKHETEALLEAGFSSVEVLKNWGATYTIKAVR